jgi:Tfp pilus assembly protein PilX
MLLRRWEQFRKANERGSALVAVLGVMVVGLMLTTLIASSVVGAFGFSSSTRAAVQSHAAADAGVAAARAGLYIAGNCAAQPTPAQYSSTGSLTYTAIVRFDAGSGFQAGCPTLTTTRVQIVSTGTALSPGVAGATAGNTRTVEATFNYITPGPHPSGPAIDLYSGGTVEANSTLDLSESAGLLIQNGNLYCDKNNTVINGDVVVTGNLTFDGTCSVNGNATVSGSATLGSGSILGNLSSASVSPNPPGTQVTGTYTQTTSFPPTSPWTDVGYAPSDWVDSTGQPFQVMTAPTDVSCTLSSGNLGGTASPGKGVIINMLGCPGGPSASNNTSISLTSDVVIFANQFDFGSVNSLTFGSSNTSVHRLWFITPDYVVNQQPTCNYPSPYPYYDPSLPTQGDFVVKNSYSASEVFSTTNLVQAMLYTPCAFVGKNGFTWNGQIYAGGYSYLQNNPTFTNDPVGIAGYDFTTGDRSTIVTSPQPGTPISNRDLAGG